MSMAGTPEAPVELPLSIARQMVTAADGRGIASALDGPITDTTVMPAVMLSCTYQDGVSVGGVNLATRAEVQRLTDYTGNVGKQVYQDAAHPRRPGTRHRRLPRACPSLWARSQRERRAARQPPP